MNTALVLSYLGTAYHGWQRQANGMTVQEKVETAVHQICGTPAFVSGCGRTDAGVHAAYYVASGQLGSAVPLERLPAALNSRLPGDIAVHRAVPVDGSFDARFSCQSKEYTYVILNRRVRDPFWADRAYFYPRPLDAEAMNAAAALVAGRHDFACFMSAGSPVKSTVRNVLYCTAGRDGDFVKIRIRADGFLYNMVRTIAGTLIYCGLGKLRADDIPRIIAAGDRARAGPTAPACGLYMTALTYGVEALDGQREI